MREIVLDTETTGLEANGGDRVFEIGCVELFNHMPTGETFYALMNPTRPLSQKSIEITGFTDDQLVGKPRFEQIAPYLLRFLGDDTLVIHNAAFDIGFLNMEFGRIGAPPIAPSRVIDTLAMAKKRFPGAQANLDALCRRFGIDNSGREKHGALLDSELLAEVYLELRGGRQPGFELATILGSGSGARRSGSGGAAQAVARKPVRPRLTEEEAAAHLAFVEALGPSAAWRSTELYPAPPADDSGER